MCVPGIIWTPLTKSIRWIGHSIQEEGSHPVVVEEAHCFSKEIVNIADDFLGVTKEEGSGRDCKEASSEELAISSRKQTSGGRHIIAATCIWPIYAPQLRLCSPTIR